MPCSRVENNHKLESRKHIVWRSFNIVIRCVACRLRDHKIAEDGMNVGGIYEYFRDDWPVVTLPDFLAVCELRDGARIRQRKSQNRDRRWSRRGRGRIDWGTCIRQRGRRCRGWVGRWIGRRSAWESA